MTRFILVSDGEEIDVEKMLFATIDEVRFAPTFGQGIYLAEGQTVSFWDKLNVKLTMTGTGDHR